MKNTNNKNTDKKREEDEMKNNMIKGAAGVAITAGVVAAGITLMDKDRRENIQKNVKKGMKNISETAADMREEYAPRIEAVAHKITSEKKSARPKSTGRSSKKVTASKS